VDKTLRITGLPLPLSSHACGGIPSAEEDRTARFAISRNGTRAPKYREGNQRYVAIKYSVRGPDLGGTLEEAIGKVGAQVKLPRGHHIDWEGEYENEKRAEARLLIIVPLTVLLIFIILYLMFRSFKWTSLILVNVMLARSGGLVALWLTRTNNSASSGWACCAVRHLGADRRHHARIHRGPEAAPDHHYYAGGETGPAPDHVCLDGGRA
jgi:hypothetical protein